METNLRMYARAERGRGGALPPRARLGVEESRWRGSIYTMVVGVPPVLYFKTLIAALMILMSGSASSVNQDSWECISSLCLAGKATSFRSLTESLRGAKVAGKTGFRIDRSVCFVEVKSGASLVAGFSGDAPLSKARLDTIFWYKKDICALPAKLPQSFATPLSFRQVAIRMHENDVIVRLGTPKRIDDAVAREARNPRYLNTILASRYGKTRLHYTVEEKANTFVEIGIDDGVVVSVWISGAP